MATLEQVLSPLQNYGIIRTGYCFGSNYPNPNHHVNFGDYKRVADHGFWNPVSAAHFDSINLNQVKDFINRGSRIILSTRLGSLVNGFGFKLNSANIQTRVNNGLWACKQPNDATNYCDTNSGYHAIVIIGYDDSQQLLKVRNSWGINYGDNGNYYMTYAFYNAMHTDTMVISR